MAAASHNPPSPRASIREQDRGEFVRWLRLLARPHSRSPAGWPGSTNGGHFARIFLRASPHGFSSPSSLVPKVCKMSSITKSRPKCRLSLFLSAWALGGGDRMNDQCSNPTPNDLPLFFLVCPNFLPWASFCPASVLVVVLPTGPGTLTTPERTPKPSSMMSLASFIDDESPREGAEERIGSVLTEDQRMSGGQI